MMRTLIRLTLLFSIAFYCFSSTLTGHAQQPPYDQAPSVKPPYYRVRYEGSQTAGELEYPVAYTVWIPLQTQKLRGVIVHQHGCGEGSCKSGQTGAFDLHWQALAQKHACALLSPAYEQKEGTDCQRWCDPRNGSAARFQQALVDLGKQCGHDELSQVPWALWGHSGGGHWAGGMVMLYPERVVAAWLRSGVPLLKPDTSRPIAVHKVTPASLRVPIMCNFGTKEGFSVKDSRFAGVWPSNEVFFDIMRNQGALIGISVDPKTSHECGNQRYLSIPWLDACLTARLSNDGSFELNPIEESSGYLTPKPTPENAFVAPVPASAYVAERKQATWLPTKVVAEAWFKYVADTEVDDATPPPAPRNIQVIDNELRWDAVADLESGIEFFEVLLDGKIVAQVPEKPSNPFGRPLFQGLQYSDTPIVPLAQTRFSLTSEMPKEANRYRIITVNTRGLKSE